MKYHRIKSLIFIFLILLTNIDLYAQTKEQNSEKICAVSVVSKGKGRILCNEQYKINHDDRKELALNNNANFRLKFSPDNRYKMKKQTKKGINKIKKVQNNQMIKKGISQKTVKDTTFDDEKIKSEYVNLTLVSGTGGVLYCNGESIVETKRQTTVKKGSKIILICDPQNGFELKKLSVNGILRDVTNNSYSFNIQRNSEVNVVFSEYSNPSTSNPSYSVENKPKFVIDVCGPGKAILSGEINGTIPGNANDPYRRNKEEFLVTNGSNVNIKLDPVQNIKCFRIGSRDLTQTVKSSNGLYTIGVTHKFPKTGSTFASVEFTQRHKVVISNNNYGNYRTSENLKKTDNLNCYIIDKGSNGQLLLTANKHCQLINLTVNGINMLENVNLTQNNTVNSGPTYEFILGTVDKDYNIVATFEPDPKLTIVCGQYGSADRAGNIYDPTKYVHYLDPDYNVNSAESKTFFEPSASKSSAFYGKPWILRMQANEGYELAKLVINGIDVTSKVKRVSPDRTRNNQELSYISLGIIKQDTRTEISFRRSIQQDQQVKQDDWVDLGTGVKWATRNVGANNITDIGGYYSWKEASALKVQKGRLPTYNEIMRLINDCHPEFTKHNGVAGIKFYHKSNRDIFIFIPVAGYFPANTPNSIEKRYEEGAIWTSTQTGTKKKIGDAVKDRSMNPIGLIIGDFLSQEGYDRAALAFSVKEQLVKSIDADIPARLSVRLVLDQ